MGGAGLSGGKVLSVVELTGRPSIDGCVSVSVVTKPFVPHDFDPPRDLRHPQFHLVPLGVEHNVSDHAAWTSSIVHIHSTPGWESTTWPPSGGMSLQENRVDLERHARDFAERTGFTFTMLKPGTAEVIGCVYIYPVTAGEHDAEIRSWVRADVGTLDTVLHSEVSRWITERWPFKNVRYAQRSDGHPVTSAPDDTSQGVLPEQPV